MRTSYLICYDICDDKRLRKVFQTMRGFGDHLQFSVFECQDVYKRQVSGLHDAACWTLAT